MPIGLVILGLLVWWLVVYGIVKSREYRAGRVRSHVGNWWKSPAGVPDEMWLTASWVVGVALVATVVIMAVTLFPYSADYHRLRPTAGVVQAVDTRFMAASSYVVVTYQGGLTVRCDDSRCATVKAGQTLNLFCTKEFTYGATSGWGCRWGGVA